MNIKYNLKKLIPDKIYLKLLYRKVFKKKLNLKNPKTFNEKMQWLKLYDRNPLYTTLVDKYQVKQYISDKIGENYVIPTIGIYNKFSEINFDELPESFVMKCTHDSESTIICTSKKNFDIDAAKKKIEKCMSINYYYNGREWPYKNVKPRIIIEKYINNENQEKDLKDYKFFCFNGEAKIILVCSNRNGEYKNTDFFDVNWNQLEFTREKHFNNSEKIMKPDDLDEMLNMANKLSSEMPFIRVDLYDVCGKIYFGELTFFPSSGFEKFNPEEYDKILGEMIMLPKK